MPALPRSRRRARWPWRAPNGLSRAWRPVAWPFVRRRWPGRRASMPRSSTRAVRAGGAAVSQPHPSSVVPKWTADYSVTLPRGMPLNAGGRPGDEARAERGRAGPLPDGLANLPARRSSDGNPRCDTAHHGYSDIRRTAWQQQRNRLGHVDGGQLQPAQPRECGALVLCESGRCIRRMNTRARSPGPVHRSSA